MHTLGGTGKKIIRRRSTLTSQLLLKERKLWELWISSFGNLTFQGQ